MAFQRYPQRPERRFKAITETSQCLQVSAGNPAAPTATLVCCEGSPAELAIGGDQLPPAPQAVHCRQAELTRLALTPAMPTMTTAARRKLERSQRTPQTSDHIWDEDFDPADIVAAPLEAIQTDQTAP